MTFIKGQKAWNKGTPQGEEAKEKNRLAHLNKYSGKDNPMYGKTHTKGALSKMIDANVGRRDSAETKLKKSLAHKNLNPSDWGAGFKPGNVPWNKASWKNAYFAGLIDGDGTISIDKGSATNSQVYRSMRLRLALVDGVELLREAQSIWGGWIYKRERHNQNPNWSDYYEWVIQNKELDKCLKAVAPYLRLKKRQAQIAIEYRKLQTMKRTIKSGGIGLTTILPLEWEYRANLETELKSLHLNKGKR